jgi:integrase
MFRRLPRRLETQDDWKKLTPAEAVLALLERRKLQLQPKSQKAWRTAAVHLRQHLNRPIADLGADDLTLYQQTRLNEGASRGALQNEMIITAQALRSARPDLEISIPSRRPEEERQGVALTDEEISRLLQACDDHPQLHLAVLLGLHGMRHGEIVALRWGDVLNLDGDETAIHIRHSKTRAGLRKVPLTEECAHHLRRARNRLVNEPTTSQPIFPHRFNPRDTKPHFEKAWTRARKIAGLTHVRFHDLRHTAITRMCEQGVPDWVIRAYVGHVSEDMMKLYSHPRKKALEQARAALERKKGGETK